MWDVCDVSAECARQSGLWRERVACACVRMCACTRVCAMCPAVWPGRACVQLSSMHACRCARAGCVTEYVCACMYGMYYVQACGGCHEHTAHLVQRHTAQKHTSIQRKLPVVGNGPAFHSADPRSNAPNAPLTHHISSPYRTPPDLTFHISDPGSGPAPTPSSSCCGWGGWGGCCGECGVMCRKLLRDSSPDLVRPDCGIVACAPGVDCRGLVQVRTSCCGGARCKPGSAPARCGWGCGCG